MIILSRILKYGLNRWTNILASLITIAFVIGGGTSYPHYIFIAAVEVIFLLLIIWFAWKWPAPEGQSDSVVFAPIN
jgi:TRAP-type C4-dicarboxylate transport system permease small subunit